MSNKNTNTTPATVNPDVNAPEITERGRKLVDKYFDACTRAKKSAWSVVKVVADTITSANFEREFGSIRTYAAAIEMSPSSISLMHRAYILYTSNAELLADFSYTAVAAMLALPEDVEIAHLIAENGLTGRSSVKDVKEAISRYKSVETDAPAATVAEEKAETETVGEMAEDVTEDAAPVAEVVDTISIPANEDLLYIGGRLWTLTPEDVATIREVLGVR